MLMLTRTLTLSSVVVLLMACGGGGSSGNDAPVGGTTGGGTTGGGTTGGSTTGGTTGGSTTGGSTTGGSTTGGSTTGGSTTGGSTTGGSTTGGTTTGGTTTGGTTGGTGNDPFGLTQRANLATFDLPSEGVGTGSFDLTNAFPSLTFDAPLFAASVPTEDRLVVVEQGGRIVVFEDDPSTNSVRELLNLSARVIFSDERGLLGFTFDPDFVTNRYIYVHYVTDAPMRSVIARFTWDAAQDLITAASEKIILELDQPNTNHNGGMLAFGPDDFFYIAFGDGGAGQDFNAQDPGTWLGKILRIDVHPQDPADAYDIPLDNPFINEAGFLPEIYALGLRNPFRFSFDRQTGEMWNGDVGESNWEEVNIISAGGNYGWRVFEGTSRFNATGNTLPDSAFTPPVWEYDHSEGRAVLGGYVYRGAQHGALVGKYIFSDHGVGTVWALTWDGNQVTNRDTLGDVTQPTSFAEKANGELLLVTRTAGLLELTDTGGGGGTVPDLLSETGLFSDLDALTPASGLIEYTVNHPFHSDQALKRRWVGVPDASQVTFSDEDWVFPEGTVVVKHFEMLLTENDPASARRLETRVLINTSDGWQGFTYRWNAQENDADLLVGRETEELTISLNGGGTRVQTYEYPSRTDCLVCHTEIAGRTLGLKTPQLNGTFDYAGVIDNQLRSWNNIDLFSTDIGAADQYDVYPAIDDVTASVSSRARTYLDVNCSQCHQAGGTTPVSIDLRADIADSAMNAIGVTPAAGDLGIANAEIIAAGEKERSVLWQRLQRLDDERMPPLGSHLVDDQAVTVIGEWIDEM